TALGEVRCEQRMLECALLSGGLRTGLASPVQQSVGVERVVDARAPTHVEGETVRRAAGGDHLLAALQLLGRRAVLLGEVFDHVLPAATHLRIELERLEMHVCLDFATEPLEGAFERIQPDGTPGAGDVGYEIDLEMCGHGSATLHQRRANRPCAVRTCPRRP